jgi:hypothetical protein
MSSERAAFDAQPVAELWRMQTGSCPIKVAYAPVPFRGFGKVRARKRVPCKRDQYLSFQRNRWTMFSFVVP